jgi:hypothetical protein
MAKCTAITRGGTRCKGDAIDSSGYCYSHHPDHANDRRRAARKGGKSGGRGRGRGELPELKRRLEDLAADVLSGGVERGAAAVVNQIYNTLIRAVEQERRMRELEELAARLEEVEETLQRRKDDNRWPA